MRNNVTRRELKGIALAIVLAGLWTVGACHKRVVQLSLPPVASLVANPQTIQRGQSATLTWSTQNATDVTIDPLGPVAQSGSDIVNPTQTTTYQLTAKGPGGTAHASVAITVNEPAMPPK